MGLSDSIEEQLRTELEIIKAKVEQLEYKLADLLLGCDIEKNGERYQLLPVRLKAENKKLQDAIDFAIDKLDKCDMNPYIEVIEEILKD